jgi:hypothetical protein
MGKLAEKGPEAEQALGALATGDRLGPVSGTLTEEVEADDCESRHHSIKKSLRC